MKTLHLGDCLTLMQDLADDSVDMVLCDLPYGTTQNKWDSVLPLDQLWSEYRRVCKGAIVLTASQPFTSALVMSNLKAFKHEWIWIKNRGSNFANTVREPMKEHESVLVFSHGRWTYNKQMQERTGGGLSLVGKPIRGQTTPTNNYGKFSGWKTEALPEMRVPSSWQKFNTEVGHHPTQKPVALMEYLIRTYTNEGDVVLDNTMGSGTTGVACMNTGRQFVGMEMDPEYFEIARKRIETAANQQVDASGDEQMSLL
jgi:site-specific DNA-methyltransferase (adenine-specific)